MTSEDIPTRRPYTGSCRCGGVKYVIYLTLPRDPPSVSYRRGIDEPKRFIYRCNCGTCQKMGLLHIWPASPPDDFMLFSPLDPWKEMSDYTCMEKKPATSFANLWGELLYICRWGRDCRDKGWKFRREEKSLVPTIKMDWRWVHVSNSDRVNSGSWSGRAGSERMDGEEMGDVCRYASWDVSSYSLSYERPRRGGSY